MASKDEGSSPPPSPKIDPPVQEELASDPELEELLDSKLSILIIIIIHIIIYHKTSFKATLQICDTLELQQFSDL